jgi:hypothetical protein
VNVAVTLRSPFIVTLQAPVLEQTPPHPANVDPAVGVAARGTIVPARKECEQVPGQLMPVPVTRPLPVPASETVRL